jgi:hypothetical protein
MMNLNLSDDTKQTVNETSNIEDVYDEALDRARVRGAYGTLFPTDLCGPPASLKTRP